MTHVKVLVEVITGAASAAPWWVDLVIGLAILGAGAWVVSIIAAAIMSILLILGILAALVAAYLIGTRALTGPGRARWTPIDGTPWQATRDARLIDGRDCMHPLHPSRIPGAVAGVLLRGLALTELALCDPCYLTFLGDGCTIPHPRAIGGRP